MRYAVLIGLAAGAGIVIWLWPLASSLSFGIALLIAACLGWDRIVAWFDVRPYISPEAQRIIDELQPKADIYDRMEWQSQIARAGQRQIIEQSRRYRGY